MSRLQAFTRRIEPQDWEKFNPYARRVRLLNLSPSRIAVLGTNKPAKLLLDNLFTELAISRRSMYFFPRLQDLAVWTERSTSSWVQFTTLLLCDNLQRLSLTMPSGNGATTSNVKVFLKEICFRAPRLTHLRLDIAYSSLNYKDDIMELISHLVSLEELTLSRCFWHSDVLHVAASLPRLKRLVIETAEGYGEPFFKLAEPGQIFVENAFPTLESLEMQGSLRSAVDFFFSDFDVTRLKELRVDVTSNDEVTVLETLLDLTSRTCPNLARLSFTRDWLLGEEQMDSSPITFQTLHSLPSFRSLTHLSLLYYWPVMMCGSELVDLISQCHALVSLDLNSQPLSGIKSHFTLDIVEELCLCCPNLQDLSIYLDASALDEIPPVTTRCLNLRTLSFGFSKILVAQDVALYLSKLLPPTCVLTVEWKFSRHTIEDLHSFTSFGRVSKYLGLWRNVKALLPSLISARIADAEIIRAQRARIHELEVRLASVDVTSQRTALENDGA